MSLPKPPAWWRDAACIGHPPGLFDTKTAHGPRNAIHREQERFAKAICSGCPVREVCLADAMRYETGDRRERATIRGGLTPDERTALAKGAAS